jgi:serine/threonine-protein kinase
LPAEASAKAGGTPKVVVRGGHYGRYVPSGLASPKRGEREGGHLIYVQQGTLFAVRFDRQRLETIGQAMPVLEGITANPGVTGGAQLAFSSDGTLVYVPGVAVTTAKPIDWLTRDGKTSVLRAMKSDWGDPRFSPDGRKLAVDILDGKQRDIWVYEWERDTLTQLTFDPGDDRSPVWTPDGRRIAFASDRAKRSTYSLYAVNADGTGEVTRLTDSPESQVPWSWQPSGEFLAFVAARATGADLMILPMEGDAARGWTPGKPTVFLATPAIEACPMFSPDGRWIAYCSNEAGGSTSDVYVRPFPGPGGKWRISTEGGAYPLWSTTARELLFINFQGKVMFAPFAVAGDSFRADKPQVWSPTNVRGATTTNSAYDLHPDGKRLAAATAQDQSGAQDKVVFVSNFFDYLRKIAPAK